MAAPRLTRKEKQEQTREAIMRAAAALFAKQGYEGTSLEAIARHAGLTQGAIYSNFESKADLWWSLAEFANRTLAFDVFFTGERSLAHELRELGRGVWRFLQDTSRSEFLLAREFDLFLMRNPRDRARYDRLIRAGRQQLADLLEAGATRRRTTLPMPADQLARAIDVVTEGLLHLFMLDPKAVDEALSVSTLVALAG